MTQQIETSIIHCGNCAEVMATFPDACIDLTVTSPPYDNLRTYNGYVFDFEAIARQLYRITKPGGVVVWVVGDQTVNGSETGTSFRQALYFMGLGFNLETMIYQVPGTGAKGSNNYYWQVFEYMFVLSIGMPTTSNRLKDKKNKYPGNFVKGDNKGNTRLKGNGYVVGDFGYRDNVWVIQSGNNGKDDLTDHPAPFPEALAHDHILSWSNPGDIVLDPMCGSGTTLKMAKQLGRQWIGIDISEEYCQLSRKRVNGANVLLSEIFGGIE